MESEAVALVTRYLHAVAALEPFDAFVADDMVFEEQPNRLKPAGARSDLPTMRASLARARTLLQSQRYEVVGAIAQGDRVLLEVEWTGVLAVPLASLAAGAELRAHCAMVFELRAGKIVKQRNYDCYEAW